jgi:hypothetical protein
MGVGHTADIVAGGLSRVLHGLRGPREDTVPDLEPYFDREATVLFPPPGSLIDVRITRTWVDRAVAASTLSWRSAHGVLCPRYQRRHDTEYRVNQRAWARWLRPERGTLRRTCLVYVHGWLEPGSWVEEALVFPRWVRELDADVVHISLPFHGKRNPKNALFSGEYFWTADLVRSFEGVRQAIFDARQLVGWLRTRGYASVGAAGVSLGGSIVMLLACVDAPPDFVIPIVAHTQLGDAVENASILWRMKGDLARFGYDEAMRGRIFKRVGIADYRPKLAPERQLWIEAEEDAHIDPDLVRRQWRAWGRPNLHWISGGHMTFPLHLPEITAAMRRFLDELPPAPAPWSAEPIERGRNPARS